MKLIDWLGLLALILSLVILWQFRQILLLVFTAAVLAIAINSLVRFLIHKFDLRRPWALLLSLLIGVIGIASFIGLVVPPFIDQFQQLVELVPEGIDRLQEIGDEVLSNPPEWLPQPRVEDLPSFSEVAQQLGTIIQRVFGNFFGFFSSSVAVVLQVLLLAVLTLMFVAEPHAYRKLLLRLFPSFYRRRADDIFSRCEASLLNWLAGMSLSSLFVAICSGLSLFALGIPLAFTHALLAGVSNLVPNIGPTLSVAFPVAVALINSPGKAIIVVLIYFVIQNLESYWFSPLVMRQQVSLLPAATLVAQIFFASFLGPLGLLLAIPLAVVVKIWVEEAIIKDVLDVMERPSRRSPSSLTPAASPPVSSATASSEAPMPGEPSRLMDDSKQLEILADPSTDPSTDPSISQEPQPRD
ncbi:MAG: AI-2E family transporter [Leptolyngbyaceae bacterium]|nr:AI-2E family transporter [Leptolyngbyaceae bacterium]